MFLKLISKKYFFLLTTLFYFSVFYNFIQAAIKGLFAKTILLSLFTYISFYFVSMICTRYLLYLVDGIHASSKKMTKVDYDLNRLSVLSIVPLCLHFSINKSLPWIKYELYFLSCSLIFVILNWRGWKNSAIDFIISTVFFLIGLFTYPFLLAALSFVVFGLKIILF